MAPAFSVLSVAARDPRETFLRCSAGMGTGGGSSSTVVKIAVDVYKLDLLAVGSDTARYFEGAAFISHDIFDDGDYCRYTDHYS